MRASSGREAMRLLDFENVHSSSKQLSVHSDNGGSQPDNNKDPGEYGDLLVGLSSHTQHTRKVRGIIEISVSSRLMSRFSRSNPDALLTSTKSSTSREDPRDPLSKFERRVNKCEMLAFDEKIFHDCQVIA